MLTYRRWIAGTGLLLGAIGLSSCGGGGGEDDPPPPNKGSLTIEIPGDPFAESAATAMLSGIAFNANKFVGCTFVGTQTGGDGTGVDVTWVNSAGGSGTASQSKNCCGFGTNGFLCNHLNSVGLHNWSASVPLVAGTNVVTVTARDGSGNFGSDSVSITH
jgi:hypothetical protein